MEATGRSHEATVRSHGGYHEVTWRLTGRSHGGYREVTRRLR